LEIFVFESGNYFLIVGRVDGIGTRARPGRNLDGEPFWLGMVPVFAAAHIS
jgi:hypothetical protein